MAVFIYFANYSHYLAKTENSGFSIEFRIIEVWFRTTESIAFPGMKN